jgi:hypothetical protein
VRYDYEVYGLQILSRRAVKSDVMIGPKNMPMFSDCTVYVDGP